MISSSPTISGNFLQLADEFCFSSQESAALNSAFETQPDEVNLVIPTALSRRLPELSSHDRLSLIDLIKGNPYSPITEGDISVIYNLVSNQGFFVENIEGSKSCTTITLDFPFEQATEQSCAQLRESIASIIPSLGISEVELVLCEPVKPTLVYESMYSTEAPATRGDIEMTRASLMSLFTNSSFYYRDGIIVLVHHGADSDLAANLPLLAEMDLKASIRIFKKNATKHDPECPPPEPEKRDLLRTVQSNPLSILPFPVRAILHRFTDQNGRCAVTPQMFFDEVIGLCDDYIERDFSTVPVNNKKFFATGERVKVHDDGWTLEYNPEKKAVHVTLIRPDPSFLLPEEGLLHTVATSIGKPVYASGIPAVPLLPPALAENMLGLSSSRYRPVMVQSFYLYGDGEISDVSVVVELAKLDRIFHNSTPFEIACKDSRIHQILFSTARREMVSASATITMGEAIEILGSCVGRATSAFASQNNLPAIYEDRNQFYPAPKRLEKLHLNKGDLSPTTYRRLMAAIDDEAKIVEVLFTLPQLEHRLAKRCCVTMKHSYSNDPITKDPNKSYCAFGPPLRRGPSLSTILAWSRALRQRPYQTKLIGSHPSDLLRDILITGIYLGKSIYADGLRVTDRNILKFPRINSETTMKLTFIHPEDHIIIGYDVYSQSVVVGSDPTP